MSLLHEYCTKLLDTCGTHYEQSSVAAEVPEKQTRVNQLVGIVIKMFVVWWLGLASYKVIEIVEFLQFKKWWLCCFVLSRILIILTLAFTGNVKLEFPESVKLSGTICLINLCNCH